MHAETIPPKGRTRHRKFEPKASRSPSDVSKQSLSTLHKYRSSAVYPADVSSRAVLVVSLLSQCAWLVSFSSAASYNPTDAAHGRGDSFGLSGFRSRCEGGGRPGVWAGGLRCSGGSARQTWPNDETPDGDAGPDKRMADEGSDRQMAHNDRNEPTAVTDVACSLQTLMYSS